LLFTFYILFIFLIIHPFISNFKNGLLKNAVYCIVPYNHFYISICTILVSDGFISGYQIINSNIHIFFKYFDNSNIIQDIIQISKPGRRIYYSDLYLTSKYRHKFFIVSTNKGIFNANCLESLGIGGEVLFKLYI